jgi:pyruvate,water dikinase
VGLARLEFIVNASIKVHPMALLYSEKTDAQTQEQIKKITCNEKSSADFFVKTLAQEMGTIAAAAYPRPIVVRFSDFKSNEYRNLIGGAFFEPQEENPMIGFRGASRYYDEHYKAAFEQECKAFLYARDVMGFKNIKGLVPFTRTVAEAKQVTEIIESSGLKRNKDDFELLMMCEIPANVLLLEKFAEYFDGFSIGSNDLTQLTLGIDRDSGLVAHLFDEQNEAVELLLKMCIEKANKIGKKITICGQAPETYPALAQQLLDWGITGVSCTPQGFFDLYEHLKK